MGGVVPSPPHVHLAAGIVELMMRATLAGAANQWSCLDNMRVTGAPYALWITHTAFHWCAKVCTLSAFNAGGPHTRGIRLHAWRLSPCATYHMPALDLCLSKEHGLGTHAYMAAPDLPWLGVW